MCTCICPAPQVGTTHLPCFFVVWRGAIRHKKILRKFMIKTLGILKHLLWHFECFKEMRCCDEIFSCHFYCFPNAVL